MEAAVYREWSEIEHRHWWFVARRALFARLLRAHLGPTPLGDGSPDGSPAAVLDVGCGTGANAAGLAPWGRVVGLDPAPEALAFCRGRSYERLTGGRMSVLPFAPGSFGLVTAFDVLEHDPVPARCVEEVARVLAPGGHFLASVPAYPFMWGDHDRVAHHYRRYWAPELRALIEGAGLEVLRLTHLNTFLFPVAFVFRQLKNAVGWIAPREPEWDFGATAPPGLNGLFRRVFEAEGAVLERHDLPFGLSIACLARKPRPGP